MGHVRAAFFLDFDNVFSGLFKLDPDVAVEFATDPGAWLRRLSTTLTGETPRRWLILRCYLNPAGWVNHRDAAGDQNRLYFSRFRPSFVRAGFEVIDCPRYNATKNGADIRIVVDAVDALAEPTAYEEFVIASGDSDMTPLLQRLRRADRRTMIVSPADAAEAFTAIADKLLDSQQLLALVQGEPVDLDDEELPEEYEELPNGEAYERFRSIVTAEYTAAEAPLNMAALAYRLRGELGPVVGASNWFGFGSFARALETLQLPGLHMSQHLLWDDGRHAAPDPAAPGAQRTALPEPVERLADQLSLPRLPQGWWPAIYETLSEYARGFRFNLTQCTSWSRDRLRDAGVPVSRGAVAFVVRGTSFGGYPLHRQPPPTPQEIAAAFVGNVLSRVEAAQIPLTDDEAAAVRAWLGGGLPAEQHASAA
ncbi:NYN domain-containing protein [Dactylosporangium sp. CA-092794]|uniref:NYN domain-containing protein n=1 Tax=Dactylosporangium sp. CA-092794 TaxID=3239929 RepID=UPI003D8F92A1